MFSLSPQIKICGDPKGTLRNSDEKKHSKEINLNKASFQKLFFFLSFFGGQPYSEADRASMAKNYQQLKTIFFFLVRLKLLKIKGKLWIIVFNCWLKEQIIFDNFRPKPIFDSLRIYLNLSLWVL